MIMYHFIIHHPHLGCISNLHSLQASPCGWITVPCRYGDVDIGVLFSCFMFLWSMYDVLSFS